MFKKCLNLELMIFKYLLLSAIGAEIINV